MQTTENFIWEQKDRGTEVGTTGFCGQRLLRKGRKKIKTENAKFRPARGLSRRFQSGRKQAQATGSALSQAGRQRVDQAPSRVATPGVAEGSWP